MIKDIIGTAIKFAGVTYWMPAPARHADVGHAMIMNGFPRPFPGGHAQGFILDDNKFVGLRPTSVYDALFKIATNFLPQITVAHNSFRSYIYYVTKNQKEKFMTQPETPAQTKVDNERTDVANADVAQANADSTAKANAARIAAERADVANADAAVAVPVSIVPGDAPLTIAGPVSGTTAGTMGLAGPTGPMDKPQGLVSSSTSAASHTGPTGPVGASTTRLVGKGPAIPLSGPVGK
jgi:hypothetical protein